MKKLRSYSFYVTLGTPVAITIFLTNNLGWSGLLNILTGLIMTLYSMYAYFKPNQLSDISALISSFFLSVAFVLLSTFFLSLPLWFVAVGFR